MPGPRVQVYRNLHTGNWSVRDARTHKVIAHVNEIVLEHVTCKVSRAGQRRVLTSGHKCVHAVVEGTWLDYGYGWTSWDVRTFASQVCHTHVTYSPYVIPEDGIPGFYALMDRQRVRLVGAAAAYFNADKGSAFFRVCDPQYAV